MELVEVYLVISSPVDEAQICGYKLISTCLNIVRDRNCTFVMQKVKLFYVVKV